MASPLAALRRIMTRPYLLILVSFLSFVLLLSYFKSNRAAPSLSSPLALAPPSKILIYNRIPKTASTTLMHLPYELAKTSGFNVLLLNITRSQHMLTLSDQIYFARTLLGGARGSPRCTTDTLPTSTLTGSESPGPALSNRSTSTWCGSP